MYENTLIDELVTRKDYLQLLTLQIKMNIFIYLLHNLYFNTLIYTIPWHSQTDLITKKVNKGLYVLRRLRDFVDVRTLVTVYKTLIQPYFDYCSQVWGCLGITLQNQLQRLQNRAARIITKRGYEFRSVDILKELDLPNLSLRRNNQLCTTMYQVNNNMVPDYLIDLFTKTSTLHNYQTRQAEFNFALPKPNTNF